VRLTFPALQATLEEHTVETKHGVVAGFLVRGSGNRAPLGYTWSAGSSWRWRTPDGAHFGERSSQKAAVEALRSAYDVVHGARPYDIVPTPTDADILTAWRSVSKGPRPDADIRARQRDAAPAAAKPVLPRPAQTIVWGEQAAGLTEAVGAALDKHRAK
jgi:hypothetical protein